MGLFPDKKYRAIYADPPYKYNNRANKGTRFKCGAIGHYPVMSDQELLSLPVNELADTNCALFLWATFPRLEFALSLMEKWGFKYKTLGFGWMKTNKKTKGRLFLTNKDIFFGVGYYAKSNQEVCLLGIKGRMKPISNKVSSSILAPIREHSRKPDEARERIVELFGDIPRIELFARTKTPGWDFFGNEVSNESEKVFKL